MEGLLQQGIAAVKAGDKDTGKRLLAQVIKADPRNERAWLWLAYAVDDIGRKRECFERVLVINPSSQSARQQLEAIVRLEQPADEPTRAQPPARKQRGKLPLWIGVTGVVLLVLCCGLCYGVFSQLGSESSAPQVVSEVATASPTNMPASTSTPVSTNTPHPTNTPRSTPTSTVSPIPSEDAISECLMGLFSDETSFEVTTFSDRVSIRILASPVDGFGEKLRGIRKVNYAELHVFFATYAVLEAFPDVPAVETTVLYDSILSYRAVATPATAYSFYPESFDWSRVPADLRVQTLVATAQIHFVINRLNTEILDPELWSAVNTPTASDIETELGYWTAMPIAGTSLYDDIVEVHIDWTSSALKMYESYGRDSEFARDLLATMTGTDVVNAMYAVVSRFPAVNGVTVSIIIEGNVYSCYTCTRQQFETIGPGQFNQAGSEGKPEDVLSLLQSE